MTKEPNSRQDSDKRDVQSLSRTGILRGRRNFQRLFERSSVLRTPNILFRYRVYDDPDEGYLIGFAAGRRIGTAVDRNRVKRHMREAFRKEQHRLKRFRLERTIGLHGLFLAQSATLNARQANNEIPGLLNRLRDRLPDSAQSTSDNR